MPGSGPDLFVICKSCGAEVSPYITECPYCGNRLRKRAPKLDREGGAPRRRAVRRPSAPRLGPLRRGEIPGIRPEGRPYATTAIVLASVAMVILWRSTAVHLADVAVIGKPTGHWWRVFTAALVYDNTGHGFVALAGIALYGWLLERRHGPLAVLAIAVAGGAGGIAAAAALDTFPVALGGAGAALALLVAWALPDLIDWRAGEEIEGDLIGTAVFAAVIALLPLAVTDAPWAADATGLLAGLAGGGLLLARGRR